MTLRYHLHHVTHGCHRVVDADHSWVVLLEMMTQRLFGSLSGGQKTKHLKLQKHLNTKTLVSMYGPIYRSLTVYSLRQL